VMFDFDVTGAPGSYTLTLTSTGAPINSANDLGLFTCSPPSSTSPQCSNELPPGVTSTSTTYGSLLSSNVASFPVTGAPSADTFVFFVALNDPTGAAANVSAVLTPTATAAPEPRLLSLAGLGLMAFMVLGRHRRPAQR
jgi:hypothetical protein